jgi:hypothetical protein
VDRFPGSGNAEGCQRRGDRRLRWRAARSGAPPGYGSGVQISGQENDRGRRPLSGASTSGALRTSTVVATSRIGVKAPLSCSSAIVTMRPPRTGNRTIFQIARNLLDPVDGFLRYATHLIHDRDPGVHRGVDGAAQNRRRDLGAEGVGVLQAAVSIGIELRRPTRARPRSAQRRYSPSRSTTRVGDVVALNPVSKQR